MRSEILAVLSACVSFSPVFAIEPEVNGFWDTTGYTGVEPVVVASDPLENVFESWLTAIVPTLPLSVELPIPPSGLIIFFK